MPGGGVGAVVDVGVGVGVAGAAFLDLPDTPQRRLRG